MSDHNTDAVFSPWAKPVGMIPTFARYQAINGLKPKGIHVSLANSLLKNITLQVPRPATAQGCTAPTADWPGCGCL